MLEYAITLAPIFLRPPPNMDDSIRQLIRGDKRMLSRLISIIEQEGPPRSTGDGQGVPLLR